MGPDFCQSHRKCQGLDASGGMGGILRKYKTGTPQEKTNSLAYSWRCSQEGNYFIRVPRENTRDSLQRRTLVVDHTKPGLIPDMVTMLHPMRCESIVSLN